MSEVLRVEGLRVCLPSGAEVVRGVSFTAAEGEIVALVGESGSGKTTLALAVLAHARRGARISAGRVQVAGQSLLSLRGEALRQARGALLGYVPQDPAMALDPLCRVGELLRETLRAHERLPPAEEQLRLQQTLADVGLVDASLLRRFPHQLSGGQQQRVLLALAFILRPRLIVLDEPTTALDVTTQEQVLKTLRSLCKRHGVAALYVSHDLALVRELADRVLLLRQGELLESSSAEAFFLRPEHAYGAALLAAMPENCGRRPLPAVAAGQPLLEVHGVSVRRNGRELLGDVSLHVQAGECLALLGRSGGGKTSLARVLAGLDEAGAGSLRLAGEVLPLALAARTAAQRQAIQYVFQNPLRALNPRLRIGQSIATPLRHFFGLRGAELEEAVASLLGRVQLSAQVARQYPGELSGGERQRVAIARALACRPRVLICDEITSALDAATQEAVLDLLQGLQAEGLAILFVTHDLGVVRNLAGRVLSIEQGRLQALPVGLALVG